MRFVVTFGDESLANLARDVRLGPPDERATGDLGDDPVGGVRGLGQKGDLVGILHDPELAKDRRCEFEPGLGEVVPEAQQVACREIVGDGDPQRTAARLVECATNHRRDQRVGIIGLLPGHDREVPGGGRRAGASGSRLEPRRRRATERRRPG